MRWLFLLVVLSGLVACEPSDPVERLMEHLRSQYGYRRENACKQLRKLGPSARKAVDALRKALRKDRSAYVRRCSADALAKIGTDAARALPDLVDALKDPSGGVRMAAADAIGAMKTKAMPTLKKIFSSKDGYNQLYALRALIPLGPKALPLLKKAAHSPFLQVRQNAAETTVSISRKLPGQTGHEATRKGLMRVLFVLLRTNNIKMRTYITWSLSELGPPVAAQSPALSDELQQALHDILDNAPNRVKMYAAYALRKLGDQAEKNKTIRKHLRQGKAWPTTVTQLMKLLEDQTWYIRKHAAGALGALFEAMQQDNLSLAPKTFARQFPIQRKALYQALQERLADATWDVRHAATRALRGLSGPSAYKAFAKATHHPKPKIREHALQTLGWMLQQRSKNKHPSGSVPKEVWQALKKGMSDPKKLVKEAAQEAWSAARRLAIEPLLASWSKVPNAQQLRFLKALTKSRQTLDNTQLEALTKRYLQPTQDVHLRAALGRAIYATRSPQQPSTQWHKARLDADPNKRREALLLLAASHDAKAQAALAAALKDKHPNVRTAAAFGLGIRPKQPSNKLLEQMIALWPDLPQEAQKVALLYAVGQSRKHYAPEAKVLLQRSIGSAITPLRHEAIHLIAKWSPHRALVPLLLKAAKEPTPAMRRVVIKALSAPFALAKASHPKRLYQLTKEQIIPAITRATQAPQAQVRQAALRALTHFDVIYLSSVYPPMLQALKDRKASVRATAAAQLGWNLPSLLTDGWKVPFLRHSLLSDKAPYPYKEAKSITKVYGEEALRVKKTLRGRYQLGGNPEKMMEQLWKQAVKGLRRALLDRSPLVKRNAIFALGHVGGYATKTRKEALLQLLLKDSQRAKDDLSRRNFCLVLGRWLTHQGQSKLLAALGAIQQKPGLSRLTKQECTQAVHQLKSDDKPYVLWVDHPRSPTTEALSPAILYPNG